MMDDWDFDWTDSSDDWANDWDVGGDSYDTGALDDLINSLDSGDSGYIPTDFSLVPGGGGSLTQVGPDTYKLTDPNTGEASGISFKSGDLQFNADGSINWEDTFASSASGGEGLDLPRAPNLNDMGGGQGLVVYNPETNSYTTEGGTYSAEPGSYTTSLGNGSSFINDPNRLNVNVFGSTGGTGGGSGTVAKPTGTNPSPGSGGGGGSSFDWQSLILPLLLLAMMNRGGNNATTQAVIPQLTANRSQLPYDAERRPGSAPQRYLTDVSYTPKAAAGGLAGLFTNGFGFEHGDRGKNQDGGIGGLRRPENRFPMGGGRGTGVGDDDQMRERPGGVMWSGVARSPADEWYLRQQALHGGMTTSPSAPAGTGGGMPMPNEAPMEQMPFIYPDGRRPGSNVLDYGVTDTQNYGMAKGGSTSRLLHGPGDGTSDSINANIDGHQPARLARGEYVIDARTVAELGNGSTDAGAEKLAKMVDRVHNTRKSAKRGKDSKADRHLPA